MNTPNKISQSHLSRRAMVYVRQSTMAQVREHTESTARQYALVEEAARLGWAAARIEVIDCDLGLSGRSTEKRSGFRDVVSRVCLGEVGAIFGLEVSRLARSCSETCCGALGARSTTCAFLNGRKPTPSRSTPSLRARRK